MSAYYISDLHFGHENMAIKRGFSCADEMNEYIIKSWNSVVNKKDTVYCLGDITMERSVFYPLLDKLKGYKKIILGNHDQPQHVPELLKYVNNVSSSKLIKNGEYGNILLSHIPIHPQEFEYRLDFNIHGHVHENTYPDKRYINVSAEVIDYRPRTLRELIHYNGERKYE